jgi:predicted NBD/HSP70 family sugar kinase
VVGVLVSITTIPAASNAGVALAMGDLSEAGQSLEILLVNLAGLLADGVVTLLGTRLWARRIEAGQAIFRPKPRPETMIQRLEPLRVRSAHPLVVRGPSVTRR